MEVGISNPRLKEQGFNASFHLIVFFLTRDIDFWIYLVLDPQKTWLENKWTLAMPPELSLNDERASGFLRSSVIVSTFKNIFGAPNLSNTFCDSKIHQYNLGSFKIRTRGCWMRVINATSVLCSPSPKIFWYADAEAGSKTLIISLDAEEL